VTTYEGQNSLAMSAVPAGDASVWHKQYRPSVA
jgi:hypothetical protein